MRPRHTDELLRQGTYEDECDWPAPEKSKWFVRIIIVGGFALAGVFLLIGAAVGGRI